MLVNVAAVEASIARARRARFQPEDTSAALRDGQRPRPVSGDQKRARYAQLLGELGNAGDARDALERQINGNDLVSVNYLARGVAAARSVCRIKLHDPNGRVTGFGTGFLVAPGIIMTNQHVLPDATQAANSMAEFDYELDADGKERRPIEVALGINPAPVIVKELDFALVAVKGSSSATKDYGWLALRAEPSKAFIGEYLTIIQHPGGAQKQVCVRENKLLRYDPEGNTLWYETDTLAGSSGSPVFNGTWDVVAIHHSGVPKKDATGNWLTRDNRIWDRSMDESQVAWIANEGVRVSRILSFLEAHKDRFEIASAVVAASQDGAGRAPEAGLPKARGGAWSDCADGEMRITLPVQISVRVGTPPAAPTTLDAGAGPERPPIAAAASEEAVSVDQSNYADRPGFDENFLGTKVSLPKVTKKHAAEVAAIGEHKSGVLKYWNYSVVMNKKRRLAFFSAVNVNANQRPDGGSRGKDSWFFDTRLPEATQIGNEFYGEQREFEIDRSQNPFDRGHLTRRLDAQWGSNARLQKRNGDDSFHWTNCSPQHWRYNQGQKKWLGLEDYVISEFANADGRACVINGPVFDAPAGQADETGEIRIDLTGESSPDPMFGDSGVAIPKVFFKIVACRRRSGKLGVAGFLMSQEEFLSDIDRLRPAAEERLTDAEARLYQVRVADIALLTGLDFGELAASEIPIDEREVVARPLRPLTALSEIQFT